MLEYDRIYISEGTDIDTDIRQINQKNVCFVIIGIFLHKNFSYGPYLCDGCYNMTQKSIDSKSIDTVYVKGNAYRIHLWYMSKYKRKATSLMTNSNLIDKKGVL